MRGAGLVVAAVALAAAVLAWNGSRFVATEAKPRTKDLDFLPSATVARALSLGQPTAVAKLRWIDSFAYFQLQLERQDDRVAGADGRGGFERLYDMLIGLDPQFMPFYEHAVLNTGGVLRNNRAALGFVMRGLLARPGETHLWRLAAAELAISFGLAKRDPAKLELWLRAWEEAEDEEGKQFVRDWRRGLAFTAVEGLDTLPYWLEQLRTAKPGTPLADYVEGTVRELLAQHGTIELRRLAQGGEAGRAAPLPDRLLQPRLLPWGEVRLDLRATDRRYRGRPPAWAPVEVRDGAYRLRTDPFGYAWRWQGDRVISPGQEQRRFLQLTRATRLAIEAEANRRGAPPRDADEAAAWGFSLPVPPAGGRWDFSERMPAVQWPAPDAAPWALR